MPERIDVRDVSPAAVWESVVRAAVEQSVDAVVLAGDIIDRGNRYFESIGPLERGLRKLTEQLG